MVLYFIKKYGGEKINLLGYSLGGRVCLNIVDLLPAQVEKMILVASDGLKFSRFYFFVTRTGIGRVFFKKFLSEQGKYIKWVDKLYARGMINKARHKFLKYYLSDAASRALVVKVWMNMSYLLPDIREVKRKIGTHKIATILIMGRYDRIIPPALAYKFKSGSEQIEVMLVEKGHRIFGTETNTLIADKLKHS